MAGIPLKSGADFYNLEASRMRLHNLGADPTEFGLGQIYYNSSSGNNTSGRARLYTGTGFRSLAFMDDIAAIQEQLDLLSGDVDTDAIISNMKEVSAFLAGFAEDAKLMNVLNGKLDKTGGTIEGALTIKHNVSAVLSLNAVASTTRIAFFNNDTLWGFLAFDALDKPTFITSTGGRRELLHEDNYSSYALPLTGGTIEGEKEGLLTIKTSAANTYIGFSANSKVGYLGLVNGVFSLSDTQSDGFKTLLHSGNIGEYKAGDSDKLGGLEASGYARNLRNVQADLADIDIALNGLYGGKVRDAAGTFPTTTDGYKNGAFLSFGWDGFGVQMSSRRNKTWLRTLESNAFSEWRELAFTDSNVASATKLETPRTIWGQPFDGTGNVDGSLTITDGSLTLTKGQMLRFHNAADNTHIEAISFRGDSFHIGYGNRGLYDTYMQGNNIVFRPGTGKEAMRINSSGNVTIGNTDLAGTDTKLYVDGYLRVYEATSRRLYTRIGSTTIQVGRISSYTSGYKAGVAYGVDETAEGYIAGLYDVTKENVRYFFYGGDADNAPLFIRNNNVLIGTKEDKGHKLYVDGSVAMKNQGDGAELLRFGTERPWHFIQKGTGSGTSLMLSTTQDNKNFEIGDVNNKAIIQFYASSTVPVVYVEAQVIPLTNNAYRLGSSTARWSTVYGVNGNFSGNMTIDGDLHVKGNIVSDKEVSSGGAAEESGEGGGGTGGGSEAFSKTFTPSTTTVSVNHNISSEDVIVQVYEKDATSGKWSVVLVDIEIVDSTRVDLHFGRTETTEHKVVIIG